MSGLVQMEDYARIRARCDALEAENEWLRGMLPTKIDDRVVALVEALGLQPTPARILAMLAIHAPRLVKRSTMMEFVGERSVAKVIDIHIVKVRRALKAAGAPQGAIVNFWGEGFRLSAEAAEWLRQRAPGAFSPTVQQGMGR